MRILRTYKEPSLKAGQRKVVALRSLLKVLGQTEAARHDRSSCGKAGCEYCPIPALAKFIDDGVIETFFSRFELIA